MTVNQSKSQDDWSKNHQHDEHDKNLSTMASSIVKQHENNKINYGQQQTKSVDTENIELSTVSKLLFATAFVIFVASLTCLLCLPSFVSKLISERLVLKNGSILLDRYTKPDVPFIFKVWLFDVTNAQQVIDGDKVKPQLKEVGPFVFRMRRRKQVLSFAGDNLYYSEKKLYHFDRERSCCSLNVSVTMANIPLLAIVDKALSYSQSLPPFIARLVPRLMNRAIDSMREQLFIKRQVHELLFDGYDDQLLKMAARVGPFIGMPAMANNGGRFALFKDRNDTWRPQQDGIWGINTGARDRSQFGRVVSWNSYKRLPYYSSNECNAINGSDGALFAPPIDWRQPLSIFNNELCRSLSLVFQQKSTVQGIDALRYVIDPLNWAPTIEPSPPLDSLDSLARKLNSNQTRIESMGSRARNSSVISRVDDLSKETKEAKENSDKNLESKIKIELNPHKCFCERKSTHLNGVNICQFNGLFDMSKCGQKVQVLFGSLPHFNQADERLLAQVRGLEPNASKHTTFLDVEPNIGIVLGGKRRFQINVLMKQNPHIDGFQNIADLLLPVVWIEESAQITEESAGKFLSLYTNRIRAANWTLGVALIAALALMLIDFRLMSKRKAPRSSLAEYLKVSVDKVRKKHQKKHPNANYNANHNQINSR